MNYNQTSLEISKIGMELHSPYNDGWVSWTAKEYLYKLKWQIEDILKDSPTFRNEEEFLLNREKELTWKELKK